MNSAKLNVRKIAIISLVVVVMSAVASAEAPKSGLLKVCAAEKYKFTPKVRSAFLAYAKAAADWLSSGSLEPRCCRTPGVPPPSGVGADECFRAPGLGADQTPLLWRTRPFIVCCYR